MRFALNLAEAVEIYADCAGMSGEETHALTLLLAPEYAIQCGYVADRIAYLARHAGQPLPA